MDELEILYLSIRNELLDLKAKRSYNERITWLDKMLIKCQILTVPRMLENGYVSAVDKSIKKVDSCYRQLQRRLKKMAKEQAKAEELAP